MQHGINLPPFGALSDPGALVEIGLAAEERGWDGLFLWDHVLWSEGTNELADPWVVLSAVAATTHRIRIGPMVTPLPRRRVQIVAKQSVTLDRLSGGRLVLGVGSGGDERRELSAFGEPMALRERAVRLDESLEALTLLWSGERASYRGTYVVVDDALMAPAPLQRPRVPIWVGAVGDGTGPARRAARYDGIFPIDVDPDQLAGMLERIRAERGGSLDDFDVAAPVHPGVDTDVLERIGVTWFMHSFWIEATPDRVLRFIERGPHQ